MKLDNDMRLLLRCAMDYHGWSADELGKMVGVTSRAVHAWLAGETETVRAANWKLLAPILEEFAPRFGDFLMQNPQYRVPIRAQTEQAKPEMLKKLESMFGLFGTAGPFGAAILARHLSAAAVNPAIADSAPPNLLADSDGEQWPVQRAPVFADFAGGSLQPVPVGSLQRVPVVSSARASGYRSAVGTAEFIADSGGDWEQWDWLPAGHLLFRVDGLSAMPLIGNGSVVQIDTTRWPRRGELCAAMFGSEETPVIKYYHRRSNQIYLQAINPEGQSYYFDLTNPDEEAIHWMYPIVKHSSPPPSVAEIDWETIRPKKVTP